MNRRDRAVWKSAVTWADLGERVVGWLNGRITQTPAHLGPPAPETIPLIPALTAANRAGFVTDNSQAADRDGARVWEAWVAGFAAEDTLAALRAAVAGAPLVLTACRGRFHGSHNGGRWGCPWRDSVDFWSHRCPAMAAQLWDAWYAVVTDPEPGRNDRLWPALATFAERKAVS
jgi:hypothetical protein